MKRRFLLLLLIPLLFEGCSLSTFYPYKGFEDFNPNDAKVGVCLLPKTPYIDNEDDVTDDLGPGDPDEVFMNFFQEEFEFFVKDHFLINKLDFIEIPESLMTERRDLILDGNVGEIFKIPMEGKTEEITKEYGYVLFIQKYKIVRRTESSYSGAMDGISTSNSMLRHTGKILLWDVKNKEIVSYGKFVNDVGFLFAMTKSDWIRSVDDIAHYIFDHNRFIRKKY